MQKATELKMDPESGIRKRMEETYSRIARYVVLSYDADRDKIDDVSEWYDYIGREIYLKIFESKQL